jgi:cytochrome P450
MAFRPERWLDESRPIDEKRYFVAFGKGGRGCPGQVYVSLVNVSILAIIARSLL